MRIENRFMELLERKRRRDRRRWPYREIADYTGVSPATLSRFATQQHMQYDSATLVTLCEFLGCTVGDLLVMVEGDEPGQRRAVALVG